MGRPSKGAHAKTLIASTKITPDEEERLVLRYGTSGAGLRAAVDHLLGPGASSAHITTHVPNRPVVDVELPEVPHRHTRAELVTTEWVQGTKVRVYRCSCGEEMRD